MRMKFNFPQRSQTSYCGTFFELEDWQFDAAMDRRNANGRVTLAECISRQTLNFTIGDVTPFERLKLLHLGACVRVLAAGETVIRQRGDIRILLVRGKKISSTPT